MSATRDMTRAQYKAALARNGFRQVLLWAEDTTGRCPGVSFGIVLDPRPGRTARRATIAYLIEARAKHIAELKRLP